MQPAPTNAQAETLIDFSWHNVNNPVDIDGSGGLTLVDAFTIVDAIRVRDVGELPAPQAGDIPRISTSTTMADWDSSTPSSSSTAVRDLFGGLGEAFDDAGLSASVPLPSLGDLFFGGPLDDDDDQPYRETFGFDDLLELIASDIRSWRLR